MALAAVNIKVDGALTHGKSALSIKGSALPAPTLTTLLADIASAIAAAGGSHDSTAELTTIQTDANALVLALSSDVSVVWNTSTVTHRQQLAEALQKVVQAVAGGYGGLAV